ncbi:MAG: HvfC/BufC N-terminal domain-containing protein [Gammaproteobacteria bacterium]
MLELRELQFAFANALFDEDNAETFGRRIRSGGLSGSRRTRIYRNNFRTSLTDTLAAVYPVTLRLLGEDFFLQTARSYVCEAPSTSGDIRRYGKTFPDFLGSLPGVVNYPYLRDVARLEWACHNAILSEYQAPLDLAALRGVPVEDYPFLRFELQPGAALLASDFPVLRIWEVNREQSPSDSCVRLEEGGVHLLVRRGQESISVEPLAAGDYRLLEGLNRGERLAEAIAAVVSAEPDFDAGGALGRFVSSGLITHFCNSGCPEPRAVFHPNSEV